MLVLKVMSLLCPQILEAYPDLKSRFKSYLEDTLESRLELKSEICEDLADNL